MVRSTDVCLWSDIVGQMKRSAEVQGSKDGWDTMDQAVDAPQRASAAQLAKRK